MVDEIFSDNVDVAVMSLDTETEVFVNENEVIEILV